eukprot:scaffold649172_cov25-Prasinocladus_malaysianus.AAC.1
MTTAVGKMKIKYSQSLPALPLNNKCWYGTVRSFQVDSRYVFDSSRSCPKPCPNSNSQTNYGSFTTDHYADVCRRIS